MAKQTKEKKDASSSKSAEKIQPLDSKLEQKSKIKDLISKKVKKSLSNNKVYFETVAAFSLTLMAVIISLVQLSISKKQTELLEAQIIIEQQQALPQFFIDLRGVWIDEDKTQREEQIFIYNEGSPAYQIDIDPAIFIELVYNKNPPGESKTLTYPLRGYYGTVFLTGESKNLVATIENNLPEPNSSRAYKLLEDFRDLGSKNNLIVGFVIKQYVKLAYRDIFNEQHIEYYEVPIVTGARLLETAEGESIFQRFNTEDQMLYLDQLDASQLFKLITP